MASIGGLGSGLDTASLVAQLVQAESASQNKLKAAKGALTVKSGAWTSLGTMTKALQDKANALLTADKVRASSATSSAPTTATVTTGATARPGSLTMRVTQLATRHQLAAAPAAERRDPVGAGVLVVASGLSTVGATLTAPETGETGRHVVVVGHSPEGALTTTVDGEEAYLSEDAEGRLQLEVAGAVLTFAEVPKPGTVVLGMAATTAETDLDGLAAELQAGGAPAGASVVHDGSATPYRFVLAAEGTGLDGALTVAGSGGLASFATMTTLTAAQNAVLKVGDPATALTVERSSNTVTDLLEGVTISLVKADPTADVTLSVGRDDDAAVGKAKGLHEALNGLLSWIATNTKYDVAAKKGGPLVGDSGVRSLAAQVGEAVQTSLDAGTFRTLGDVGITAERDGTYRLDEARMREALKQDPESVARVIAAVSAAVAEVTEAATGPVGVVKLGQQSTEASSRGLQDRIDDWDLRLKNIETRYTRQFNALEVAMSKMNSQSSWLAGQIKSLPSAS